MGRFKKTAIIITGVLILLVAINFALEPVALEPIIGSKGHVSAILSGKRKITLKMGQKLKNYFNIPGEVFLHSA